jgi:hypothetical protein
MRSETHLRHATPATPLGDSEPEHVLRQAIDEEGRRLRRRIVDWAGRWLPRALAGWLVAVVAGGVLAVVSMPLLAGVLLSAAAIVCVALALVARRQLYRVDGRRRWLEIPLLRERQHTLKAEQELDAAAHALATGDHRALLARRPRHPELLRAVMRLTYLAAEARAAERPTPQSADQHRDAAPRPVDVKPIERRMVAREHELVAIEAEIQALADPSDRGAQAKAAETRAQQRAAERAALEADRAARSRKRRGLPATVEPSHELGLQIDLTPDRVRNIQRAAPQPLPEQIAQSSENGVAGSAK